MSPSCAFRKQCLQAAAVVLSTLRILMAQPSVDPQAIWSEALREWSELRSEIEGLEGQVTQQVILHSPRPRTLNYTIKFAYRGSQKKVELLGSKGVYAAMGVNQEYGFDLSEAERSEGSETEVSPPGNEFVLDDYASSQERESKWGRSLQVNGHMPFYPMSIGQRQLDLLDSFGQIVVESVDASDAPMIRISGKIRSLGRQAASGPLEFQILVNRDKRFRIEQGRLTHPVCIDSVVIEYSDFLQGGYPSHARWTREFKDGRKIEEQIIEYGTPRECQLPDSHFRLEHYGITPPPLDKTGHQRYGITAWRISFFAVIAFLVGAWALRRLIAS